MIFSELYSAYYNAVAQILKSAVSAPLSRSEVRAIIEKTAFGESALTIEPALFNQRWQLLLADGTTPISHVPTMPPTELQKRWLRAIYQDPRIRLFLDEPPSPDGVDPLFTQDDVCCFDKYADGDPFEDAAYILHFRTILDAIRTRTPLSIDVENRNGIRSYIVLMPEYLEYSEKDDKFRLIGSGSRYGGTVNLGRIRRCKPYEKPFTPQERKKTSKARRVEFVLTDERNALERVLMHFAHFEKQAERIDENRYRVQIAYDKDDETEMVIRVLSFGPMIRVTAPESFRELIIERLKKQKSCEQ